MLIAANTGFSAWIDGSGRIRAKGPRRNQAVVIAQVRTDGRPSWYLRLGDTFAGLCLAVVVVALGQAAARRMCRACSAWSS
jgi:apolipoprotein N-acyltransferase